MRGVHVRGVAGGDIDAVVGIEEANFPRPWSRAMFEAELVLPDRLWLAAELDHVLIGYAGAWVSHGEAHIMNLAVAPDAQRCGVGTVLLADLLDGVIERGARTITLEVREGNEDAVSLYESAGLTVVGRRRGYYAETGEDALIMTSKDVVSPEMQRTLQALRSRAAATRAPQRRVTVAPLVLGIETSCDETAASVIRGGREVLSSVVASQVDFHARFGGVVPEIASRKHTEAIVGVIAEAMDEAGRALGRTLGFPDLDAIAVTRGPGLVGALVVGLAYAKGLSMVSGVPLIGVNHLEGHIFAAGLADPGVEPPLVALLVSGGHTSLVHVPEWGSYEILGETLDDAAGEAFDKVAKVLGLGYPGGPIISKLAEDGDPAAIEFPRAMLHSGDLAFSLSGLKTAVINHIRHEREAGSEIDLPDLAASFQAAVIDVQVAKTLRAVEQCGVRQFVLAGGVAANRALRGALTDALEARGIRVSVPEFKLCTDNAAMIAAAGTFRLAKGESLGLDADAVADLRLDHS